jgi:ABC-type Na+ efflux pump permease subunit
MKTCISGVLLTTILIAGLPAQAQQPELPFSQRLAQSETPADAIVTSAQQFVDLLVAGDYAAARALYQSSNTTVTPETLQQNWQDIVAANGAYQQQVSTRTVPLDNPEGGTMAIVTTQFENARRDLYIVFDNTRSIVSLDAVDVPPQQ